MLVHRKVSAQAPTKSLLVAKEHGLTPLNFLYLGKHRHPVRNFLDASRLRKHLIDSSYDLIHCHLDNDHGIACRALHNTAIPIVRSNHFGTGFPYTRRNRNLLSQTGAILEPSEIAINDDLKTFQIEKQQLYLIPGAVDTVRFDPLRSLPDMRNAFGLSEGAFVLGIVARMQTHRHYEDLFEGFANFCKQIPNAHLVIIGRGTRQEEVGFEPVRKYGLNDNVHFTGYLDGDAYVGALNTFDVGLFLTPGTDGACRAAREIMSIGKAMIVADRGMLREIVQHRSEGLVTDGSATQLAEAMLEAYSAPELLEKMSQNALNKAHTLYTLQHQATEVIRTYENVLR